MFAARKSHAVVLAGVCTRISSDPSGHRAGVERQRAACEVAPPGRWNRPRSMGTTTAVRTAASLGARTSACWRRWSQARSLPS